MAIIVATRDPLFSAPYLDNDAALYGEVPLAREIMIRNAATPQGTGAIFLGQILVTPPIPFNARTGVNLTWESSYDVRVRYHDDATPAASTTMAANSAAAATNIKVTAVTGFAPGQYLTLETAGFYESRVIATVGTAGSGGTGITVTEGYTYAHTSGDPAKAYYWGPWSSWLTVKVSQPPVATASTPANGAKVTDPTLDLVHTYTSAPAKAQASRTYRIYRRQLGYLTAVLVRLPAAHWRLGETAGTAAVDLIAAHNGVYTSGYTLNQAGALSPADPDPAVLFNGTTGYITIPTNAVLHPGDTFSIVAWVKKAADGSSMTIWSGGTNDALFVTDATNHLVLMKQLGSNSIASSLTITGTGWHHVVVTKSGATQALYIDGVPDPAPTITNQTIVAAATDPRIGRATNEAWGWNGTLDEVSIWATALTAADVAALFAARLQASDDNLLRQVTTVGAGLTDTLPRLFLADATVYAWEKDAYDTDGLSGTTARRIFVTTFSSPAAVTNLVGTPDTTTSSVLLTWDASVDPNFDHYRVWWRNLSGDWIRIDGGPAVLDDGLVALTVPAFTDAGGRLGDNAYRVTVHNGALESDPADVTVTLPSPTDGSGSWMFIVPDQERYQFAMRVLGAPRTHDAITERFTPPGSGETTHLSWGRSGRRVSVTIQVRPAVDGDLSTILAELMGDPISGRIATPGYLKAPAGWIWDPMWCRVVALTDTPGIGGMLIIGADFESTRR